MFSEKTKKIGQALTVTFGMAGSIQAANAKDNCYVGEATYYGTKKDGYAGGITKSGEKLTPTAMTAASNRFRQGEKLRVKNLNNNKSVIVRVNDTGGFKKSTLVDVNVGPAKKLDMISDGRVPVMVCRL